MRKQKLRKIRNILAYAEEKSIFYEGNDFFSLLLQEKEEILDLLLFEDTKKEKTISKEKAISFYFNDFLNYDRALSEEILKELAKPNEKYTFYFNHILTGLSESFREKLSVEDSIQIVKQIGKLENNTANMQNLSYFLNSFQCDFPYASKEEIVDHLNVWLTLFLTQRDEVVDTVVRVYCYMRKKTCSLADSFESIRYPIGWRNFDQQLIQKILRGEIQIGVFGTDVDALCKDMDRLVCCPDFPDRTVYMRLVTKLLTLSTTKARSRLIDLFTNPDFKNNFIESFDVEEEYKMAITNRILDDDCEASLPTLCHFVKKIASLCAVEVLPKEQFLDFLNHQLPINPIDGFSLNFLDAVLPVLFGPSLCNRTQELMNLIHQSENSHFILSELTKFYRHEEQRHFTFYDLIEIVKILSPITDEWQQNNIRENIFRNEEFLELDSEGKVSIDDWRSLIQQSEYYTLSHVKGENLETSKESSSRYSSYIHIIDSMIDSESNIQEIKKRKVRD